MSGRRRTKAELKEELAELQAKYDALALEHQMDGEEGDARAERVTELEHDLAQARVQHEVEMNEMRNALAAAQAASSTQASGPTHCVLKSRLPRGSVVVLGLSASDVECLGHSDRKWTAIQLGPSAFSLIPQTGEQDGCLTHLSNLGSTEMA